MPTVAMPTTIKPISIDLSLNQPSRFSVSHSLIEQTRSREVGTWTLTLQYPPARTHSDYGAILGALAGAGGRSGKIIYQLPTSFMQSNSTDSTGIQVDGAGQTGRSVDVINGDPNGELKSGDLVQFATSNNFRIFILTSNESLGPSGNGTLDIAPPLHYETTNLESVRVHGNSGGLVFVGRPTEDTVGISVNHCMKYGLTVELVEVDL